MLFDDMLCLEWSVFSFQEKRGGGRGWRPEQPTNYFSPRSDLPWRAVGGTFTFDQPILTLPTMQILIHQSLLLVNYCSNCVETFIMEVVIWKIWKMPKELFQ